ncbi:ABC transporter permease [Ktedonosporobacter rubrisoli]|uniref:Transport permease protein n=1 Tax=Ktedonosporobacter rubrisoli TaxID=2509675 RepID=A0A4P6JNS7_KTERU|nr:ABC transporter permease [Ktedonosporobacter rubrisoli]QBD76979.1 ABC transporter permease [Ktedonosporobacter rubrisoli]
MSLSQAFPHTQEKGRMNITWNAILTIAGRDVMRFVRDPIRLAFAIIFPIVLVVGLVETLQSGFGHAVKFNLVTFSIVGMLAMTLFQTTMMGLTSMIEDRENDFTQELFIAPISRYAIVFGKIFGEALVAFGQGIILLLMSVLLFGVSLSLSALLLLILASLVVCLFGGAFGVLVVSVFNTQRAANQIMPFIIFPQFFLAGVFMPVNNLPWYLDVISKITPMLYTVDLIRGIVYAGTPQYHEVVLFHPLINLVVIAVLFLIFLIGGTMLFVRSERNR